MLTVIEIRALKPRDKPYKVADRQGLFLLVQPSGSLLWRFKYRFRGFEKKLSFGRFPEVSLREARTLSHVRAAYHRGTHWDERVRMAQWWSDHLEHLRDGAKVLRPKFRKGRSHNGMWP